MLNKMIVKELKRNNKKKCQSVKGCNNLATNSIWIKGEGKPKLVCDDCLVRFYKTIVDGWEE